MRPSELFVLGRASKIKDNQSKKTNIEIRGTCLHNNRAKHECNREKSNSGIRAKYIKQRNGKHKKAKE